MTKKIVITLFCIFVFSSIGAVIAYGTSDGVDFNKTIKIDEEKVFTIDDVNQINIKSASADINFIFVESNEIKVKYYGEINCFLCNVDYKLSASKSNNTIEFDTNNESFNLGIAFFRKMNMDVYMPEAYASNLYLKTSSSDVNLKDITLDYLNIRSASGNIKMSNLTLNKAKFNSISGDVDIMNMTVSNDTSINTVSGEILLENITSKINLDSISGDIEINDINGDLNASTTSGEIEIYNLRGDLNASTTSGEIEIHEMSNSFDIRANSVSGDVVVDVNQDASFNFIADTVSGDIEVKFEYLVSGSNSEHYVRGRVGDSSNNIDINTTSGDVIIK